MNGSGPHFGVAFTTTSSAEFANVLIVLIVVVVFLKGRQTVVSALPPGDNLTDSQARMLL